ncbi:hypothetical protein [Treponema berlinense]|uniref:hypothetical protein n=1 Tax=Treponema berlinense TaxID=225004 RepID=UPI003F066431
MIKEEETSCFSIFRKCVNAIHDGVLIVQENNKDKEFHFQNWCQDRIIESGYHYEGLGRNVYPDFCLVEKAESYEIN